MFHQKGNTKAISFLKSLAQHDTQSRTILLLGAAGWGKFSAALDFAEFVLQGDPLYSSNFFYFRNDQFQLKTSFFLKKMPDSFLAWNWINLLQHRLTISQTLNENLTLPTTIKLNTIKEELQYILTKKIFPDPPLIEKLILTAQALDKKKGIPIDVIREALQFHSIQSSGRISLLGDFHTADETTQNAALKMLEEPPAKHWIILTAANTDSILPTILSRSIIISFKKPLQNDLAGLPDNHFFAGSTHDIMNEHFFQTSSLKKTLIQEFFETCVLNIDKSIQFLLFAEKLEKQKHTQFLIEELELCIRDSLILRQGNLRNKVLPLMKPEYQKLTEHLAKGSTAELEELMRKISAVKKQISRSVIKSDAILPNFFLDMGRSIRVFQAR